MKIQLLSLYDGSERASGTVIIIDVFRAFTVETVAFAQGIENFLLTDDAQQAIRWRNQGLGQYVIGEVGGDIPVGFDLPNSPRPFLESVVDFNHLTLIHRSSSGTAGICWAAPKSQNIYAASFNIAEATVQAILKKPDIVSLVAMVAGGSQRTDEDELCAYYLRNHLEGRQPDIRTIQSLVRTGNTYHNYRHLADDNYPGDTEIALGFNTFSFTIQISMEGE
jgi:2-phosphosulfolactate phosphatase